MLLTIACNFTRPWAVDGWIESMQAQVYEKDQTNLALIVDGNYPDIEEKLAAFAEGHRSWLMAVNEENVPFEAWPERRRQRIVEVKNQSRELVDKLDAPVVIGLEDDTVLPRPQAPAFHELPRLFERLARPISSTDQVGFVEAVQCGRWGIKMIGAWGMDDFRNPTKVWTLPLGEGVESIDGGGMYCYATRKSLYVETEYSWENWQPWGPDVNFVRSVKERGFLAYVDWGLKVGHNDHGRILWPDVDIFQVEYEKTENGWLRTDKAPANWNPS